MLTASDLTRLEQIDEDIEDERTTEYTQADMIWMRCLLRDALRELEAGGWRAGGTVITVDMTGEEGEAQRVYDLIEEALYDNGQIGTLSMCVSPPTTSDGGK